MGSFFQLLKCQLLYSCFFLTEAVDFFQVGFQPCIFQVVVHVDIIGPVECPGALFKLAGDFDADDGIWIFSTQFLDFFNDGSLHFVGGCLFKMQLFKEKGPA